MTCPACNRHGDASPCRAAHVQQPVRQPSTGSNCASPPSEHYYLAPWLLPSLRGPCTQALPSNALRASTLDISYATRRLADAEDVSACCEAVSASRSATNLPVLVFRTHGQQVPDEPKIPVQLCACPVQGGTGGYEGPAAVEVRGSSSARDHMRKSWALELRDAAGDDAKAPLLGARPPALARKAQTATCASSLVSARVAAAASTAAARSRTPRARGHVRTSVRRAACRLCKRERLCVVCGRD